MSVLAVIVTYNPDIDVINRINNFNFPLIIVDNSDKSNLNIDTDKAEGIAYIKNHSNLGIAKALNIGAKYALENGYDWLLTLDQDSEMNQQILLEMLDFIKRYDMIDKLAVLSPRHIMQYGVKVNPFDDPSEYTETVNTMTSGNLLNLKIWQDIGGFDEPLFIDMVDVDYYCKAVMSGYKVLTLNHVYLKHYLGNLREIKVFHKRPKIMNHSYIRKYYQIRNSLIVYFRYRRYIPELKLSLRRFLLNMLITLPFETDRVRKLRFMFLGIFDFLRHKLGKLNVK